MPSPFAPLVFFALSTLPPGDPAPQFQVVEDAFLGPTFWTEAVAFGDVDNDGDLDVFLARGEGWMEQGRKHQCGLYVNRLEEQAFRFEDQSVERLGYFESHAKSVVCADVQGDGWVDALFSNAFHTAPPFLFVNRGSERPGYFRQEGASRGLTEVLSSGNAAFGDVDDDGDLDLVIADSGPSFLRPPGGRARLYTNDGRGYFAEAPGRLGAPLRVGQMGVHLADVDGDFDLDFFGPCRTGRGDTGHYLLINAGRGYFHDASWKIPKTTGGVYEADMADLDGDGDLDLFFTSLSETEAENTRFPLGEGPMRNLLAEDGRLAFEKGEALGADDDNDVALLDYDMDGDLDAFIASLGPKEKVLRNDGGMRFAPADGVIQAIADPSLDIGLADLDNDGRIDIVTAQGLERIGAEQPPVRVYRNNGPRDDRPPRILAQEVLRSPGPTRGPWVVHARVQDDAVCNGDSFVTGEVRYVVLAETNVVELTLEKADDSVRIASTSGQTLRIRNGTGTLLTATFSTADASTAPSEIAVDGALDWLCVIPGTLEVRSGDRPLLIATIEGDPLLGSALQAGKGFFRFEMRNGESSPPNGERPRQLGYQLRFEDRAGNRAIGLPVAVELSDERPRRRRASDG